MAHPTAPGPGSALWEPPPDAAPLTIQEAARRLGHYRWIEMRVFELLGGWTSDTTDAQVKLAVGTHCYKHAWHSELWQKLFPVVPGIDADGLTVAGAGELEQLVAALVDSDPTQTIERLVGVYRVLIPRKIAAYSVHLRACSPITDGPTIRALTLALRDELDDWRDGELLIQSLLVTDDDLERAATQQVRLEKMMIAAGGIAGPASTHMITEPPPSAPGGGSAG